MLKVRISKLKPSAAVLNGAVIGDSHAQQIREQINESERVHPVTIELDFTNIESASASYLKRLLTPFFSPAGTPEGFPDEIFPILTNANAPDLKEDLRDYLSGKGLAMIAAKVAGGKPKFGALLGRLDGAAQETFNELLLLRRATALQLYERHRTQTTNQTAWNNRLTQLMEMRIASRTRNGRTWTYQPTVAS